MTAPFSLNARAASFKYAMRGVVVMLREQHNARIHLLATVVVILAGWGCAISRNEWMAVFLAVGGVWMAEALNTALEYIADALHPEQHPLIRNAKDVAAAAVLVFALCAAVVGWLVFGPHLLAGV